MENQIRRKKGCRVLLFPLPYQGHLNPMLQLANMLHSVGFTITIIHTEFNSPNHSNYPHFTFYPLKENSSEMKSAGEIHSLIDLVTRSNRSLVGPFRDCLSRLNGDESKERIGCLITDAHWHFTQAVANGFNIPRIVLRTSSLSSSLVFAAHQIFREKGSLSNNQDNSPSSNAALVLEFPELKTKDISLVFTKNPDIICYAMDKIFKSMKVCSGIIWNSFTELEQPALEKIHQLFPPPTFTIGPFHKYFPASNSSLFEQDKTSISWLNSQQPKSVLYVSFGSLAAMNESDFLEMAWGLANSMQPFLWVVRPGLVRGSEWIEPLPNGFLERLGGRGCIVKWAPQQEVLAHSSTGVFWTHNGWNSTLESICEGVPMICSPCFGDQLANARYVSEVWKVGVQLENGYERGEIEKAIKMLFMEEESEEMREKIMELKEKVDVCLKPGGSSYMSLDKLVNYILSF